MNVRGVIFDLDGTVIDSRLDFEQIRREMQLPPGQPLLEALDEMPESRRADCLRILRDHELHGARQATLMPGVAEFLELLAKRNILQGLLTRNSREATELALGRLGLRFSAVVTREEAPPKPDPGGLLQICEAWQIEPAEVLFFGDFLFDVQAGRQAGIKTVLYVPGESPPYADEADFVIDHFSSAVRLVNGDCSSVDDPGAKFEG